MVKSLSAFIQTSSVKRIIVSVYLMCTLFLITFSILDKEHFSGVETMAIQSVVNYLDSMTSHYRINQQELLDLSRRLYVEVEELIRRGDDLNRELDSLLVGSESTIMILDLNLKVIHASIPSLKGTELRRTLTTDTILQLNKIRQSEEDYFMPVDFNVSTQEFCSFYFRLSSTGLYYVVIAKHVYSVNTASFNSVNELNHQLRSSSEHFKTLSIRKVPTITRTSMLNLSTNYLRGNTWTVFYPLNDPAVSNHDLEITLAFDAIRIKRLGYAVFILMFMLLLFYYLSKVLYKKQLWHNFDKPLHEFVVQMELMQVMPSPFFKGSENKNDYLNLETLKKSISTILIELSGFKQTRKRREEQLYITNEQLEHDKSDLESKKSLLDHLHTTLEGEIVKNDKSYYMTVKALSRAIEYKDVLIHGHSERVEKLAVAMGQYLNLSNSDLTALQLGALLHDIGKIGLSEDVLKRRGYINNDHYHHIQNHAQMGYDIVKDLVFLKDARLVILQHHEHVDGNGYPLRLKHEQINILARIVGICDAFDAMTSERSYRERPLSQSEAIEELYTYSDKQFDRNLVVLFDNMLRERRDLWQTTTGAP